MTAMPKWYLVRVYNDAKQQQGRAFEATKAQLIELRAELPLGWIAVARRIRKVERKGMANDQPN
jgi:hypothetical protein